MQKCEADLHTRENQMITQFHEIMTLLKTVSSVQSTDAPNNRKNDECNQQVQAQH